MNQLTAIVFTSIALAGITTPTLADSSHLAQRVEIAQSTTYQCTSKTTNYTDGSSETEYMITPNIQGSYIGTYKQDTACYIPVTAGECKEYRRSSSRWMLCDHRISQVCRGSIECVADNMPNPYLLLFPNSERITDRNSGKEYYIFEIGTEFILD